MSNCTNTASIIRMAARDARTANRYQKLKVGSWKQAFQDRNIQRNTNVWAMEQRHGTTDMEYYFALLDYRDKNKIIKKSTMTHKVAHERNRVLAGTGMAWARIER